jgi:hypothetical protein
VIRLRSTTQTAPAANSFAGSANSHTVQILLSSLRSKMTAAVHTDRVQPQQTEPSASDGQNDGETAMTDNQLRQTMEEATDDASAGGELNVTEEWGDSAQEPYAPEIFQTETVFEKNRTDDMPLDSVLEKPLIRPDLRPTMRLRVILNENEIPSREELEKQTFNDSSDFFEEAPDRLSGVVTSQELDALTAPEDAQEPQRKQYAAAVAQRLGGSVKSAGVHVGYFVTNIGRAVKRRRELSKRQKAGEERRRRQMERRRQERAAMERRSAAHDTPKQTNDDNRKQ